MKQIKKIMIDCPTCGGSGEEIVGENRVTQDMAIDAGEPQMEGMFHSWVFDVCSQCGGTGQIEQVEEIKSLINKYETNN